MQYLGVEYSVKHMPELDPDFIPFGVWLEAYARGAEKPLTIALERDQGKISVRETKIHGTPEMAEADYRYVERYVKFLLWSVGGFRIWICGDSALAQRLQRAYTLTGERAFDVQFMQDVYEVPFEVIDCTPEQLPQANESSVAIGGHMEGCRIGFDAGGSDRKVSAVIDGRTVIPRRSSGTRRRSRTPSIISTASSRRSARPHPKCRAWTASAFPPPVCLSATARWSLPCS